KRCGGRSVRVTTIAKRSENGAYEVYQCLDCKCVEWLPQDRQSTALRNTYQLCFVTRFADFTEEFRPYRALCRHVWPCALDLGPGCGLRLFHARYFATSRIIKKEPQTVAGGEMVRMAFESENGSTLVAIHPVVGPFRRGVQTARYIRSRMRNRDRSCIQRRRFLNRRGQIAISNTLPRNSRAPDLPHR